MELATYEPSNSTDASCFEARWCTECKYYVKRRIDGVKNCDLNMIFYVTIGESKWLYSEVGEPFCPKFKNRNEKPKPIHNRKNKKQLLLF